MILVKLGMENINEFDHIIRRSFLLFLLFLFNLKHKFNLFYFILYLNSSITKGIFLLLHFLILFTIEYYQMT